MTTYFCNTSNHALTKSTGKVFLRQFRIGSIYYGMDSSGIYRLEGNTDDGTVYDSVIKLAENNFNEEASKRLPEVRIDKTGTLNSALIYDGVAVSEGVEAGESGFIRFGKGGGGKLISLLLQSDDENLKLRSAKLMSQVIGIGGL
jgi:hypothetical protein